MRVHRQWQTLRFTPARIAYHSPIFCIVQLPKQTKFDGCIYYGGIYENAQCSLCKLAFFVPPFLCFKVQCSDFEATPGALRFPHPTPFARAPETYFRPPPIFSENPLSLIRERVC
jgi:hypothetical protein